MSLILEDETFGNEFDLTERTLDEVQIIETIKQENCYIWDRLEPNKAYDSFILSKNSRTKTVCRLTFHKSKKVGQYIPRPIFQRVSLDGEIKKSKSEDKVIVDLSKSDEALRFWRLFSFISSYKELVDTGEFAESFKVVAKDSFIVEFKDKALAGKIQDLQELISLSDLSASDIRSITFEQRKKNIKTFYYLLKDLPIEGRSCVEYYRNHYKLPSGNEAIWHHFLKKYDWILGLNVDIRFTAEFLDEQKVGMEDSKGKTSPKTDLLGISDFTTLVELKHPKTPIFKSNKSKSRANTWDFTADFIEGVSQCLGQKFELEKLFEQKVFIKEDKTRLDKNRVQTIDPKSVFLIGNKKAEFPIDTLADENLLKSKVFERFRRNNRNIDILTFDELFERAYQIVYSTKLPRDWYLLSEKEVLVE